MIELSARRLDLKDAAISLGIKIFTPVRAAVVLDNQAKFSCTVEIVGLTKAEIAGDTSLDAFENATRFVRSYVEGLASKGARFVWI